MRSEQSLCVNSTPYGYARSARITSNRFDLVQFHGNRYYDPIGRLIKLWEKKCPHMPDDVFRLDFYVKQQTIEAPVSSQSSRMIYLPGGPARQSESLFHFMSSIGSLTCSG